MDMEITKSVQSLEQGFLDDGAPAAVRDLETIKTEIIALQRASQATAVHFAIQFGWRLDEAKSKLEKGEWIPWLHSVGFKERTAQNYIRIAKNYSPGADSAFGELVDDTFQGLNATQALRLLAVPADERAEFAKEVDAEHLSDRQLQAAIRERDAAIRERDIAEDLKTAAEQSLAMERDNARKAANTTAGYQAKLNLKTEELMAARKELEALKRDKADLAEKLEDLRQEEEQDDRELTEYIKLADDLQARIIELEARPVEVAVQTVRDEEAIRQAVEAEREKMKADADKGWSSYWQEQQESAELREKLGAQSVELTKMQGELDKAKEALQAGGYETMAYNMALRNLIQAGNELAESFQTMEDAKTAAKLAGKALETLDNISYTIEEIRKSNAHYAQAQAHEGAKP